MTKAERMQTLFQRIWLATEIRTPDRARCLWRDSRSFRSELRRIRRSGQIERATALREEKEIAGRIQRRAASQDAFHDWPGDRGLRRQSVVKIHVERRVHGIPWLPFLTRTTDWLCVEMDDGFEPCRYEMKPGENALAALRRVERQGRG